MSFNTLSYSVCDSNLNSDLLDFATQYALFDEMSDFSEDDRHVLGTHSKYADPAMETILLMLQKRVEEVTNLELFPTYSFYRVYRKGAVLKKHLDRPSCEISTTVFLGRSDETSWPIFMQNTPISLERGQMVVYRGCELEHWRDAMPGTEDSWHVQGFFHYVDKNGPNSEYKWDKRQSIGMPEQLLPYYIQKTS